MLCNLRRERVTVEEAEVAIIKTENGKSQYLCGISARMLTAGQAGSGEVAA